MRLICICLLQRRGHTAVQGRLRKLDTFTPVTDCSAVGSGTNQWQVFPCSSLYRRHGSHAFAVAGKSVTGHQGVLQSSLSQARCSRPCHTLQDHAQPDSLDSAEAQNGHAEALAESAAMGHDTQGPKATNKGIYHSDRAVLGLGLYALSSVFLATMLICAKTLKQHGFPVWQNLLARSLSIMTFALIACARQRVNPFGNR